MKLKIVLFVGFALILACGDSGDDSANGTAAATGSDATTGADSTDGVDGTDGTTPYPDDCDVEPKWSSIQENYFAKSCTFSSCHGPPANAGQLDLTKDVGYDNLIDVDAAIDGAKGKKLVVPGNALDSFLYQKLVEVGPNEGGLMPFNAKEPMDPECRLRAVREWIDAGAENN